MFLAAALIALSLISYASSQLSITLHQELSPQVGPSPPLPLPPSPILKARPTTVFRPRSLEALHRTRLRSLYHAQSELEPLIWDPVEISGPDIEDLHTLAQLSRMSANAYHLPLEGENWFEIDHAWNSNFPFGWDDSHASEGFRGHVFLSSDNSTIVLAIKGTTLQGPTSKLDKFNDNLLFSCCCARVDISWVFQTVCTCYANNWRCDNKCLTNALVQDSLFYSIGVKLVDDLIEIYPSANIWLVGHSLGGALASLLGATYGLPAVAFESPGEKLAASRLHLPLPPPISDSITLPQTSSNPFSSSAALPPPGHHPIATTHVYHNADPIPQGACTGFGSPCTHAGYAIETRCHLGKSVIFDTVGKLGWSVSVRHHVIRGVVMDVLGADDVWWGDDNKDADEGVGRLGDGAEINGGTTRNVCGKNKRNVPKAIIEEGCIDCYKWEFGDYLENKD